MNDAHKQAAKESKDGSTRFVVYVPDEGAAVYTNEQMAMYRGFVFADAAYLNGIQVAA